MSKQFSATIAAACLAVALVAGCGRNDGSPPPGAPAAVPDMNVQIDAPKEPAAPKTESTPGAGTPAGDKGAK
ncbi:MAG: hypothetical protein JSS27_00175 [Planctomycetes bacterium]|nr:hypothetical protein [Planctomycetota bacterium]